MLTALIASDRVSPLDVLCENRKPTAVRFMVKLDYCESIEFFSKPEEYPPYYWGYHRAMLEESARLTQFAINDLMALG